MYTPPTAGSTASLNISRAGFPERVITKDFGAAAVVATANSSYVVTASVGLLSTTFSLT
jgi:hypothetical protein